MTDDHRSRYSRGRRNQDGQDSRASRYSDLRSHSRASHADERVRSAASSRRAASQGSYRSSAQSERRASRASSHVDASKVEQDQAAREARRSSHRLSRQAQAQSEARESRTSQRTAGDYSADRYSARKSGMSTGKKVAIAIVIVLVIALAGAGIAAAVWYNNVTNNIKGNDNITNLVAPAADEPYYVLLMGSDSREGWEKVDDNNSGERADSIMVARVDEKNKKVSILSVPRDLRVKIDGHGYKKINSCVEYGGYNLLITKLNEIFDIKINYYATVYFNGFLDLVDKLGGVTVAVPEGTATYNEDETKPDIILPAGEEVQLNGEQALVLARCRHGWPIDQGAYAMGDYQRTLNQRNLIKAIAKKVLQQDITKMPALVESLSKSVETNMSVDKIIALAQNMKGMDLETMQTSQLPIGASTIQGEWEALMYQDVFELLNINFKSGNALYEGLDKFNPEANDDNVNGNYIDGPVYAYTTYTAKYGSPYSNGFTPSALTQEAIERTRAGVSR